MSGPLHPAAVLRRVAQSVRHAPGVRDWNAVWRALRRPYSRLLRALGGRRGVPVTIGGCAMRLDPAVVNVDWETVERASYRTFAAAVHPDDVVVDVGAHFGTYTLTALARGGPGARVVAYEPCGLTRAYLARHLAWNGAAGRVIVRPVCCGSAAGTAVFHVRAGGPEGANGLIALPGESTGETLVEMVTLDEDLHALDLIPAAVKIDVEGAELDVLRGAERLLADARPVVFVSLHAGPLAVLGLVPGDVTAWLDARGYGSEIIATDQEIHVMARPR